MPFVYTFDNPFDRTKPERGYFEARTINELLAEMYPENLGPDLKFLGFAYPTVIMVNGAPLMIEGWDDPLEETDHIALLRLAGDPATVGIIIAVVIAIAAVAVSLVISKQNPALIGAADEPGQQKNGDTVYSINGQHNQNRLNSSIECVYGKNRLYPAYAAAPYNVYSGNQQFQFSLFCLGHGSFKVHQMLFDDTLLQNFDDVEFEIVRPGETFDLFADDVQTSTGVSGIELFGPNEKQYTGPTAGYVTNRAFTVCHKIEVDLVLPGGLYKINGSGDVVEDGVRVSFQYQQINDTGAIIGPWRQLIFFERKIIRTIPASEDADQSTPGLQPRAARTVFTDTLVDHFSKDLATLTPQRFTMKAKVAPGRYKVRAVRTNGRDRDTDASDQVNWEAMRAFMPNVRNYGDVTLVAIKARASNNLNNNAATRFNVIATRKLPTWTPSGGWGALAITRNPVWAFCDVFRATYGGKLPDNFLDMATLYSLAAIYESSHSYFDYIFDQRATVWEAARTVARVGRAVPMLNGSQVTMIRDRTQTVAVAMFNQNNIVAGSFGWSIKLPNIAEVDGVEVSYIDPDTWQPETVLCLIDDDLGDNPDQLKLSGCTSRDRAYQEGLYLRASQQYQREIITFKTGLEGFLPTYGDLIMVSHDVPRWGSGGLIKSVDGLHLTLSEPVTFDEPGIHRIAVRKTDGTVYGPVTVTAGTDEFHVDMLAPLPAGLLFDDDHERPMYVFGLAEEEARLCVVTGLTPEDGGRVAVKAVNYDSRVFGFGPAVTPGKGAEPRAVQETAFAAVTGLNVWKIAGTNEFVQVSWQLTVGAKEYILELSQDGVHYDRLRTTQDTVYIMRVHHPRIKYLRVAGVSADSTVGPWFDWHGYVGTVAARPGDVLDLHVLTDGPGTSTVTWDTLANTDAYVLEIQEYPSGIHLHSVTVYGLAYTYTLAMGAVDGMVGRQITVNVRGRNLKGLSIDPADLVVVIPELPTLLPATADSLEPTADDLLNRADNIFTL